MIINKNIITLTEEEVRKMQVIFRRINKDPEKFASRPDEEKVGISYNENDKTWSIAFPTEYTDENIDSIIDSPSFMKSYINDLDYYNIIDNLNKNVLFEIQSNGLESAINNKLIQPNGVEDLANTIGLMNVRDMTCIWSAEDIMGQFDKAINEFNPIDVTNEINRRIKSMDKSSLISLANISLNDINPSFKDIIKFIWNKIFHK